MKWLFGIVFIFLTSTFVFSQNFAFKSNLLYDVTSTLNLGFELGMGKKMTIDISGNYNPWKFNNFRLKHWLIQPEIRYWFCERFNGHSIGLHGYYADYNVGGLFFNDNIKANRYQGYLYGAGISYGHQWILSNRWGIEVTLGLGYTHLSANKYPCTKCGVKINSVNRDYFGLSKLGLLFIYIIK